MKLKFSPDAIGEGRAIKQAAKDKNIKLQGRPEASADVYLAKLDACVESCIHDYQEPLKNEWDSLKTKFSLEDDTTKDFEDVVNAFRDTLRKRLKLYARTTGHRPIDIVNDKKLVELLFSQAVFDFIMSLRVSARSGETYKNALGLAGLSHWLNPMEVLRLHEKYGEKVDDRVIKQAALGYPKNPAATIDKYLKTLDELRFTYGEKVDNGVITRAALFYPKNPAAFIDKYLKTLDELRFTYGEKVDDSVIKHAALGYPTNPAAFIDKYLEDVEKLTVEFGDKVQMTVIKDAAFYRPNDPTGFIRDYQRNKTS